jgi:cytochrome b6-f complex iron-sulfur subunit
MIAMPSCNGCTRRAVLKGLGLVVLGDCGAPPDHPSPPDAVSLPDAEAPVPCEPGKLCIDVTRTSSGTLGQINGTHTLPAPTDLVMAVRTGATTFIALSAVCTHESCTLLYAADMTLRCRCHGSAFTLDGTATIGPATVALKVYSTDFDATTNILTITL